MIENKQIRIAPGRPETRLDVFLLEHFPTSTRSLVAHAIQAGEVLVNGKKAPKGKRISAGEDIRVLRIMEISDLRVRPDPALPLCILYEDESVIAVDKPSGMPVHPLQASETGTLANALLARHPELADVGDDPLFPSFVHRLDTETSGVVLAARSNTAYAKLRDQFKNKQIGKTYLTLVQGSVSKAGHLENYLSHHPGDRRKMMVEKDPGNPHGIHPLRAVTSYTVRKQFVDYTLLEVTIATGVTHQIRCQLAHEGHPVAGDRTYGHRSFKAGEPQRLFLHAAAIRFVHPSTGKNILVESALPVDLRKILSKLEKECELKS